MLELKYKVVESPDSLEIWLYDITGVYHSANNPTGWGGANPNYGDVTTASLTVIRPDPTTLEVSSDPSYIYILPASPLPNVIGDKLVLNLTDLGLLNTDFFIDGKYSFQLDLSGVSNAVPFSFTWRSEQVFFAKLYCCAEKATADAEIGDCNCAPCRDEVFKKLLINLGVDGIIKSNGCGKPDQALTILKTATGLCNGDDCQGCK